ncbi:MAG: FAD-dependent oxidoreductase [Myxococcota bacterium]
MPRSARGVPQGSTINTEIAIVGAGPAGLTVARGLRARGRKVLVLEAGGTEMGTDDDVGVVDAPKGTYDLRRSHFRGVGGCSPAWYTTGWKARPLDPEDFEARAHVADSGWPFSLESLRSDFEEAQTICELGPLRYDGAEWVEVREERDLPGRPELEHPVFQLGPYGAFTRLAARLEAQEGFEILTEAKVVAVRHEGGERAESLQVVGPGGSFQVRAQCYVLAAGGFDVPRLLLASGLGNEHDLVGRFFQEHLHSQGGHIELTDPSAAHRLGGQLVAHDGTKLLCSVSLSREVREREGLLGCVLWLAPVDEVEVSPTVRSLWAFRSRWRVDRRLPEQWPARLAVMGRSPRPLLRKLAIKAGLRSPRWVSTISFESECEPRRDSRVILNGERDAQGMPKATLEWRLGNKDLWSVRASQLTIGRILEKSGYGRLVQPFGDETPPVHVGGGAHHMGTARMHHRPEDGVVNPSGRLHRCANVYVAGSSVFPTSGSSNPTLTLVALAHRLSGHLDGAMESPSVGPS